MQDQIRELTGKVIGGCRVESLLGAGAMGAVYKGRHLALQKDVAIKILGPRFGSDNLYVQRFLAEARLAAQIDHPNVVHVLNVGCEDGLHFIIMQYVLGESLATRMAREGPLPIGECVRIGLDIARGLAAAHAKGIIHRDIKPANVMLTSTGDVKVADLGLAKAIASDDDASLTQAGETMGTPQYMPPEQAEDARSADPRSDIYALGCTIYHMLVGAPPFTAKTTVGVLRKHVEEIAPSAGSRRSDVPKALSDLIARMMAKSRNARPQDIRDIVAALEQLNSTTLAPAPKSRPHPLVIGIAAGAIVVSIALLLAALKPTPAQKAFEGAQTLYEHNAQDFAGAIASFERVAEQFPDTRWATKAAAAAEAIREKRDKLAQEVFDQAAKACKLASEAHDYAGAAEVWNAIPATLRVGPVGEKIRQARVKARLPLRIHEFWELVRKKETDPLLPYLEPEEVATKGREPVLNVVKLFTGLLAIGADVQAADQKKFEFSADGRQCTATIGLKLLNKFNKQVEIKDVPQVWLLQQDEWYAKIRQP